ncbi:unnamed protein product, partial [Meganyctiphanes norvegica]
ETPEEKNVRLAEEGYPIHMTTEEGVYCRFPFVYLGQTYTDCTTDAVSAQPFCAVTVNQHNHIVKAGICIDNGQSSPVYEINQPQQNLYQPILSVHQPKIIQDYQLGSQPIPTENSPFFILEQQAGSNLLPLDKYLPYSNNQQSALDDLTVYRPMATIKQQTTMMQSAPPVVEQDLLIDKLAQTAPIIISKQYPTRPTTEEDVHCQFPFIYLGQSYTDCITDHVNSAQPFCAVAVDASNNLIRAGVCLVEQYPTRPTTEEGVHCQFPFIYLGQSYTDCITNHVNRAQPFCAVAVDASNNLIRAGVCLVDSKIEKPLNLQDFVLNQVPAVVCTVDGIPCVFPFRWDGAEHWRCYAKHTSMLWCATAVDVNLIPVASGYCQESSVIQQGQIVLTVDQPILNVNQQNSLGGQILHNTYQQTSMQANTQQVLPLDDLYLVIDSPNSVANQLMTNYQPLQAQTTAQPVKSNVGTIQTTNYLNLTADTPILNDEIAKMNKSIKVLNQQTLYVNQLMETMDNSKIDVKDPSSNVDMGIQGRETTKQEIQVIEDQPAKNIANQPKTKTNSS